MKRYRKFATPLVMFGGGALVGAGLTVPSAMANIIRKAYATQFVADQQGHQRAAIPTDSQATLASSVAPTVYFDFIEGQAQKPVYIQMCRQAYYAPSATCGKTTKYTTAGKGNADVWVDPAGAYSPNYSDWDYYFIDAWGEGLGSIIGGAFSSW